MTASDFESSAFANQTAERVNRASAPPDVSRHGGAGNSKFGERPKAEDETGAEHYVERVRQPENAHCDRRVTRSAKNRIDHKQHDHARVAGDHDARKPYAMFDA